MTCGGRWSGLSEGVSLALRGRERRYLERIEKESKEIFQQLRESEDSMALTGKLLRRMYEDLKKMCRKPGMELLWVKTEKWRVTVLPGSCPYSLCPPSGLCNDAFWYCGKGVTCHSDADDQAKICKSLWKSKQKNFQRIPPSQILIYIQLLTNHDQETCWRCMDLYGDPVEMKNLGIYTINFPFLFSYTWYNLLELGFTHP